MTVTGADAGGEPAADQGTASPDGAAAAGSKWTDLRADVLAGTVITVAVAALGAPMGLLWSVLAPRVVVVAAGPELADPSTKAFIGADATFLLLGAAAGVVCGVLALLLGGRRHGVATALGLTAGGLAASYIAWRVGHRIELAEFRRAANGPAGTATGFYLTLRARGVLVAWALTGVFTVLVAAVHARDPDSL